MPCGCAKENKTVDMDETTPTTQCIACAQKHADQACMAWNEWGYRKSNRRFIRGELRAIVLHCYKRWPSIADKARECALAVQDARDEEAEMLLSSVCSMVDDAFDAEHPETKARMEALQETAPAGD